MRSGICVGILAIAWFAGGAGGVEDGRRIWGRVTDDASEPVAGAVVSAWSSVARGLRDPAMTNGQTDEQGRFDLTVEFADVRYTVWVHGAGYDGVTANALAGEARPVRVSLKRQPRHALGGSVTDSASQQYVPGASVVFIPEYGDRREVRADAAGRFEITDLPESFGQGLIYARGGDRASPFQLVRTRDREVALTLGEPAALEGRVSVHGSGEILAGCRVVLKPSFMSAFTLEATSAADG